MAAVDEQIRDLQTLQELEEGASNSEASDAEMDSDEEDMKRIISKQHGGEDESDADMESGEEELGDDDDEEMESDMNDSEEGEAEDSEEIQTKLTGKKALRAKITEEKEIRKKEAGMRSTQGDQPKNINDFERLLVADSDQSYLWIQYIAFVLEKVNIEGARKIAERAVNAISMVADNDKLNLWIAYMNLESQFGDEKSL